MSTVEDIRTYADKLDTAEVDKQARLIRAKRQAAELVEAEARAAAKVPKLISLTFDALLRKKFPPRPPILNRHDTPVIRAGQLGQLFAERGLGKTWFMATLALVAAYGCRTMGFSAPKDPVRVLYVDGEMGAEEIQERFGMLARAMKIPEQRFFDSDTFRIIAADWQDDYLPRLDTTEGQAALAEHVEWADWIILDNRSCLFDPEGEKDPTAWQPAQEFLLRLRREGKAVTMVHHAARAGNARGHSKPEDPLNLILKLSRPDDYDASQGASFIVEFEKARGIRGEAAAPFHARMTDGLWETESMAEAEASATEQKLRSYIIQMTEVGEAPKTATAAIRGAGVKKPAGLKLIRAWKDRGWIDPKGALAWIGPRDADPAPRDAGGDEL
jgi:putative DNA primase/helicase